MAVKFGQKFILTVAPSLVLVVAGKLEEWLTELSQKLMLSGKRWQWLKSLFQ